VSSGGSDLPLDDAAYDRIRKEASNRTVPFLIVKINERVVTLNTLYDEAIAAPDAVEFPQRIVKIEAELVQAMADLNKAEQFANSEDSKNKVALATTSLDQFKGRVDANRVALVKLVTDASTAIVNKPVIATETEHTALLEHVKGMNAAFNLMKIMAARSDVNPAIDDVLPLKVPRDNALKAFRPAEINFHLAKCQAELDRIKVSAIHPQEMGAAAKLPPLEASLQRAKAALEKATASLLQTKEEKLVDVVPLTANVDLAKTKLQDLEREVTALKEKIINRTATGGLEFLPDNELFKKRLFIEKNGLLNFTDTVIRRENADTFNNEMNMSPTTQATADQGGSVAFENDSAATFQSVKLREGDVVRSHITFERPPTTTGPTPPAVGLLKQDHTGKVTNMSDMAKLTKEEQGVVALKQAQMLMNNYRPESGNIIIRGKNPEMANKVYAALLLLKESNPKFKNAEIKSFVPGCTGPGVLTRNSSFIETHLGTSASKDLREQISKDTGTFTSTRFARLKEINKLNKATPDGAKDYVLKEGDELDHKGTKTPRG